MENCGQCSAITVKKKRCTKEASCRIGCQKFCWIHSEMHDINNQRCVDERNEYEYEYDKTKKKLERLINKRSKQLKQLLRECNADIQKILRKI